MEILIERYRITMPNGIEYLLCEKGQCWEFTGKLDKDGYPRIKVFGKSYRLNRVVLAHKLKREIQPGYLACHSCDNPACLNPDHLWEGTNRQNIIDAISKGRVVAPAQFFNQQGSKNRSAKLTESMVVEIRELYKQGSSTKELAERFKVSRKAIQGAIFGRYWSHVDGAIAQNMKSGSRNPSSKLTENQVIEIRSLYHQGYSGKLLAKTYGVSDTLIYSILNRKVWTHV
ncbi:MAG: hypothetical protein N4J56_007359 [Chroococcidiopsis sp. SAG 2025]|nr:hypothetical protein [Chroococcidiopsis sp. SAG 2025]